MESHKKQAIINQRNRHSEFIYGNTGSCMLYTIEEASALFNLSETDFLDYLVRLRVLGPGYFQSKESIDNHWFMSDGNTPHTGRVGQSQMFLTSVALKAILSILIDNALLFCIGAASDPYIPLSIDKD